MYRLPPELVPIFRRSGHYRVPMRVPRGSGMSPPVTPPASPCARCGHDLRDHLNKRGCHYETRYRDVPHGPMEPHRCACFAYVATEEKAR